MSKRYKLVLLGGTFELLHAGHEALIREACRLGERVIIGLTSDEFAQKLKGRPVQSFKERKKALLDFVKSLEVWADVEIVALHDRYGMAVTSPDAEAIVVSPETEAIAHRINESRRKAGLGQLDVIIVDLVLAEDGLPVTTTRIREGIIDRKGRLLKR